MSTETHQIAGLEVAVVRKDIKNLHLGVYPPDGRIRVAAPAHISDEAVRLAVIDKLGWIKRQRATFAKQARQSRREMVSGEDHYLWGQRYRLDVVQTPGVQGVSVRNNDFLEMRVRGTPSREQKVALIRELHRAELKARIPSLLEGWCPRVGVERPLWGVKRMKTRWGSCTPSSRRIWLNLELAKKPLPCLEFVLVHELVHLIERHHTDRFRALMDRAMPNWRAHRRELNAAPLAHEDWTY